MREIIREGKKLPPAPHRYIKKCRKCGCIFLYEGEDVYRPTCLDFFYLRYVDCPQCNHSIEIKKNKIYKNKKPKLKAFLTSVFR